MKVFERLNELQHLTPDEIAAQVCDPFAQWRECSSLTEDEYARYSETEIVILHLTRRPDQCEKHHKIAAKVGNPDRYHAWGYSNFTMLLDFSFRSKISWENNPYEELPECQRSSSPF